MGRFDTTVNQPTRRLLAAVATSFAAGLAVPFVLGLGGGPEESQGGPTPSGGSVATVARASASPDANVPSEGALDRRLAVVTAAVDFVCSGQALLDVDPLTAEEMISVKASVAAADDLAASTLTGRREVRSVLAEGSGPVTFRQAALAWRVESLTAADARVAVWNVGVLSREGVAPPQAGWSITTIDLVWERDAWRVTAEAVVPGPAPVLDDSSAPATSAQLDAALDGFTPMGDQR